MGKGKEEGKGDDDRGGGEGEGEGEEIREDKKEINGRSKHGGQACIQQLRKRWTLKSQGSTDF